jgi:hypothetical protein
VPGDAVSVASAATMSAARGDWRGTRSPCAAMRPTRRSASRNAAAAFLLRPTLIACRPATPRSQPRSCRASHLHEAIRAAAHADAEAAELWQRLGGERRYAAGGVIRDLKKAGPLRSGLDTRTATDLLWVLNDPALYRPLVDQRGWTTRRFRIWLTETMQVQLRPPPRS